MKGMMDFSKHIQLAELYEKYQSREISRREASDILQFSIQQELIKPDNQIDNNRIEACLVLMQELDKKRISKMLRQAATIRQHLHNQGQMAYIKSLRPILSIATCLILILCLGVIGHFSWIHGMQIQHDQIYRLEGNEITIGQEAHADNAEAETVTITTAEYESICALLGYAPPIPTWVPEDWFPFEYVVNESFIGYDFTVGYAKEGEDHWLLYSYESIADIEHYVGDIPQDNAGWSLTLVNGQEIYLSTNMEEAVVIWISDQAVITISGPATHEELIHVLQSAMD